MTVYVLILVGVLYNGPIHFVSQPFPTREACTDAASKMFPVVVSTDDLKAYGVACAEVNLTGVNNS